MLLLPFIFVQKLNVTMNSMIRQSHLDYRLFHHNLIEISVDPVVDSLTLNKKLN